jgi:cell division protein FtsB
MLNPSKWLLIGAFLILVFGVVGLGTYTARRFSLIEEKFNREIEEIKKEIKVLKENIDQLKREVARKQKETFIKEIGTSNWKIFRDEELGFEIRYPKEAYEPEKSCIYISKSKNRCIENISILLPTLVPIEDIPKDELEEISAELIKGGAVEIGTEMLEIEVMDNHSLLPIKDWVKEHIKLFLGPPWYEDPKRLEWFESQIEDIILTGVKGVKIEYLPSYRSPPVTGACRRFFLPKSTKVYDIGFCLYETWESIKGLDMKKVEQKVHQRDEVILSTFRIL